MDQRALLSLALPLSAALLFSASPARASGGTYPKDCPYNFSPQPLDGTPCDSLQLPSAGSLPNTANIEAYAAKCGIDVAMAQDGGECAHKPSGRFLCWSANEQAKYYTCLYSADGLSAGSLTVTAAANQYILTGYQGQPYNVWYAQHNPGLCKDYRPTPDALSTKPGCEGAVPPGAGTSSSPSKSSMGKSGKPDGSGASSVAGTSQHLRSPRKKRALRRTAQTQPSCVGADCPPKPAATAVGGD